MEKALAFVLNRVLFAVTEDILLLKPGYLTQSL